MRYRKTLILISALAAVSFMSACKEETPTVSFGVSSSTITIGAEGGNEVIHIDAEDGWTANSTSPWISISPSNGIGSTDCEIVIDTTLLADKTREGIVRFMSKSNKTAVIRVVQTGYEKMIVLNKTEVDVPSYEDYKKRYIDVEVTANVDFVPTVTADKEWVQLQDYDFELDRGSRPRTVKLRLRWENNTRPSEREALLSFKAKDGSELSKNDKLSVKQVAAEEIEDSRRGDSLAVVGCARSLGFDISEFEGESMDHWTFLTLWEKGNKGYTEDKKGRVRSIKFSFFQTMDGIPYEIQFLRKCEDVEFFSNGDWYRRNFSTGEYISKMTQLKRLQMTALGLVKIDDSFKNLKNLEFLGIVSNNFNEFPDILTPENFPNLKSLDAASNRRVVVLDMKNSNYDLSEWGGFVGEFPKRLLYWDKLEYLRLSYNYIYGKLPDMKDYDKVYTEEDIRAANDTLPDGKNNPAHYNLIGKPKVLPNLKFFGINLNVLEGELPEWILYHPHLMEWDPETIVFNQSGDINDFEGKRPGFTNVPENMNYYYEAYPLKKPADYVEDK